MRQQGFHRGENLMNAMDRATAGQRAPCHDRVDVHRVIIAGNFDEKPMQIFGIVAVLKDCAGNGGTHEEILPTGVEDSLPTGKNARPIVGRDRLWRRLAEQEIEEIFRVDPLSNLANLEDQI
jgi:hypothetical protein